VQIVSSNYFHQHNDGDGDKACVDGCYYIPMSLFTVYKEHLFINVNFCVISNQCSWALSCLSCSSFSFGLVLPVCVIICFLFSRSVDFFGPAQAWSVSLTFCQLKILLPFPRSRDSKSAISFWNELISCEAV